jgi:uncharacterized protein YfcZ (UPF0381/DUF406 family)
MNEDIIEWAREAGFVIDEVAQQHQPNCIFHTHHMVDELLHRFAALVRADEREACAKVCDVRCVEDGWEGGYADECAAEIRARSQA